MPSARLSIPVSGSDADLNPYRITLEQEPVPQGNLSLTDLTNMLALVRSGISARKYIASSCPATLSGGIVTVPLTLYAWPSHYQEYALSAALPEWTTIGEQIEFTQDREFDLVIENTDLVDLPCMAAGLSITWQSPAIRINGEIIDPPEIQGYDVDKGVMVALDTSHGLINRIRLATPCFGVLRVRCMAIGYRHAITMEIPKTDAESITDIEETITAAWMLADGSTEIATQKIALPPCVEDLLAACDDGSTVGDHVGSVDDTKYRTRLRYSTCTGKVLDVREIEVNQ